MPVTNQSNLSNAAHFMAYQPAADICQKNKIQNNRLIPFLWLCQLFVFLVFNFPLNNCFTSRAHSWYVHPIERLHSPAGVV